MNDLSSRCRTRVVLLKPDIVHLIGITTGVFVVTQLVVLDSARIFLVGVIGRVNGGYVAQRFQVGGVVVADHSQADAFAFQCLAQVLKVDHAFVVDALKAGFLFGAGGHHLQGLESVFSLQGLAAKWVDGLVTENFGPADFAVAGEVAHGQHFVAASGRAIGRAVAVDIHAHAGRGLNLAVFVRIHGQRRQAE